MFLVVDDVPINSKTSVVTSSILSQRFAGPVFDGAHSGRVSVRMLIGVNVRAL